MNKRHFNRSTRSGQVLWMLISLVTLFLFIGTLALVYMQMDFFQKEGMWPSDKTNLFMKRGDETAVFAPPRPKTPAPVPVAIPGDTNAVPENSDSEAPAPAPAGS